MPIATQIDAASTKSYYVTAKKVNVRAGAGTKYRVIGSVTKNAKLTVNAKPSNGWYRIKFKGKNAYITTKYVVVKKPQVTKKVTVSKASGTFYITTNKVNVRTGAGTNYKSLGTVSKGTKIVVNGKASNGWYLFKYKEKAAYISGSYISSKKPVTVAVKIPSSKYKVDSTHKMNSYEQQLLNLINEKRINHKLNPLKVDNRLNYLTRLKALDIGKYNYRSHTSKTYGTPFQMMKNYGVTYKVAGENLAGHFATAKEVVKAWENSPGHRKIMYDSRYTYFGAGYSKQENLWSAMFIKK